MSTTPLQKPARAFLEPQSRAGVSPARVGGADAILALARSWGRRDACSRGEKGKKTCTHDNLGTLGREYCARKRCRRCALPPQSMTLAGSRCRLVCAIYVQRPFPIFLSANFSVIISVPGSVKWMAAVMDAPVPPSFHYGATRRRRKAGFIGIWRKCL